MSKETISEKCAKFILDLDYSKLDERTIQISKWCILDWLGCVITGLNTQEGNSLLRFVSDQPNGDKRSSIIGSNLRTSPAYSSLLSGYNCHIHEIDDVHNEAILHLAAPIISAALSISESERKTGKELIEAIVAGYDVTIRIGKSVMPSHYKFWHATGTCGAFGSTAAVSKLLGLSQKEIVNAIGNIGSITGALWEFINDNAMTKYLHCGNAAMKGVLIADMCRYGITGAKKIIEGEKGFIKAMSSENKWEDVFTDLGKKYLINETTFKPYASCRHTHSAIEATIMLKKEYKINPADVKEIVLETYDTAVDVARNNHSYSDMRSAKFSMVYCIATALKKGRLSMFDFTENDLKDSEIKRLASNTKIIVNKGFNEVFPKRWPARVKVVTGKDTYESMVENPKGDPGYIYEEDIISKFIEITEPYLTKEKQNNYIKTILNIEDVEDCYTLFQ